MAPGGRTVPAARFSATTAVGATPMTGGTLVPFSHQTRYSALAQTRSHGGTLDNPAEHAQPPRSSPPQQGPWAQAGPGQYGDADGAGAVAVASPPAVQTGMVGRTTEEDGACWPAAGACTAAGEHGA